jgi:hypothetical protein
VCCLTTELEVAGGLEVEVCACSLQLSNARGTFFDEHLHGRRVTQCGSSGEGIAAVQFR